MNEAAVLFPAREALLYIEKRDRVDSRGDGFWTALGKSVVRAVVPMATRVLEDAIRRNTLGGHSRRR